MKLIFFNKLKYCILNWSLLKTKNKINRAFLEISQIVSGIIIHSVSLNDLLQK